MTQQEVAERSGVSLGSLKRFERAGLVAFDSLLRIAFVLGCLGDFDRVCAADLTGKTLDDLIGEPRKRQRGTSPHKRSR